MIDVGDGLAVAFKVESHNHPSAVEPFQGAATGVGGILRDIVAMGARPIALLDGLRFGDARLDASTARSPASATTATASASRPSAARRVFDDGLPRQLLVNAMCVGLLPTERVTRAKARAAPGNAVVLYGATTGRDGIGGACVLASQELGEDDADKRPDRADRRPVHGQEADRGVARARRARARRVAAGLRRRRARVVARRDGARRRGHRRPPRPRAAARGGHRAVGDHDLGVAGADGRGRPARALDDVARCARAGSCRAPVDRRGHRHRRAARVLRRRASSARSRPRCSPTSAPRYEVERGPRARRSSAAHRPPRSLAELLARRTSAASWVYEQYDQLVGSRTVRRPGLDAAVLRLRPSLRGLAVSLDGPAAPASSTRARRALRPCSRRRSTSPAPAASRSRSPTASTSATRRSRRSPGSSPRRSRAWREAARRSGSRSSRATSRSTTRPTAGRSTRRRWSAASGSSPDVRARARAAGARATSVLARGRTPTADPTLDAEAALVRLRRRRRALRALVARARRRPAAARGRARRGGALERRRRRRRRCRRRAARCSQCAAANASARSARAARRDRRRRRRRRSSGCRSTSCADASGGARLMCGVFGIRSPDRDVARLAYFGLFALQHRGQESAGIAVSDRGRLTALRDMGLVTQVFDEEKLRGLHGELAIGHTRYSTTGSAHWANAQPLVHHGRGAHGRARPQRQPRPTPPSCATSSRAGRPLALDLRHRGDRRADRERPGAARGGGRARDGAARRRVLGRRALRGHARRLPRPARHPAALPRAARRRLGRRLRDLRARPHRRRASCARSRRASS